MSCGKACISTDVPGCREAVRHEDNGMLVPAKDAVALSVAIGWLLDHPASIQKMGARGRQRAIEEFSQERVVYATLAVYREVLA
jgi:glycosyltransferase involved in cell wall biosynthesis